MTFWEEVFAIFLGDIFASVLIILFYVLIQWFLRATDVIVGYGWKWESTNSHPSFDVRNRSASKTYSLANIVYTKNNGKDIVSIDNKSIWDKELRPGSISWLEASPVRGITSKSECLETE